MPRSLKWTIEDNVVALYLALHGPQDLSLDADEVERVIANTLVPKKGFRMRVQNYRYVITGGKEGLDAGYPDGFPLYRDLFRIFGSLGQPNFRDYVEAILRIRERMMGQPARRRSAPSSDEAQ